MVWMLVGVLAPAALAVSAPAPHACCMRKPMHQAAPNQASFGMRYCGGHECCRSLAVSQRAQTAPSVVCYPGWKSSNFHPERDAIYRNSELLGSRFVRGPPLVS